MFKKFILILSILSLILVCASAVSADDLNDTVASDFDELSNEITLTHENQTLNLQRDYVLTNTTQKHIVIDKPITIDGNNHYIESVDTQRVFWVLADNVVIKNVNFINSRPGELAGGAISWFGNNGVLENCNFTNNSASSAGGAVLWNGNDAIINNCNFESNNVFYGVATSLVDGDGYDKSMLIIQIVNSEGGALFMSGNNAVVNGCSFTNNAALLNGGAISVSWGSNITISNSRFKNNSASYNGGAIDLNGDNVTIVNSTLTDNTPKDLFSNGLNTQIINSTVGVVDSMYPLNYGATFDDLALIINNASEGSVIVLDRDYSYINGSNKGILINKTVTIDGAGHKLVGNKLSRMFNVTADNVVLRNITFENGKAFGRYYALAGGGAIYWYGANGMVENCTFTNNTGSGVEDDPFENEETYTDDDGRIWHAIRIRPMGAKINEGGAIVWNGTNGTVKDCIFIGNVVGYPNSGGAICWRGNDGRVIGSQFHRNEAWCGAAICWIGDNGLIMESEITDNGFFDGGIYWFGKNGTVTHSVLISNYLNALRCIDGYVNADYNFWGDTIVYPYKYYKPENVSNWIVMNITHNGEFVVKGQEMLIKYDANLLFENGTFTKYPNISDKFCGEILYVAPKTGFLNITLKDDGIDVKVDSRDSIVSKDVKKYYAVELTYKVRVYDVWGVVRNQNVKFKVDGEVYNASTDENGVAILKVNLKPGKHKVYSSYGDVKVKNTIKIKTVLKTKNLHKKVKKPARFKVKVLNSKGKAYSKQVVQIKFKGKTYKVKTNKRGIATFNVPKNLKVGKHVIKTSYKGLTNSNKIIVRK